MNTDQDADSNHSQLHPPRTVPEALAALGNKLVNAVAGVYDRSDELHRSALATEDQGAFMVRMATEHRNVKTRCGDILTQDETLRQRITAICSTNFGPRLVQQVLDNPQTWKVLMADLAQASAVRVFKDEILSALDQRDAQARADLKAFESSNRGTLKEAGVLD
jgi:hypothetical protein